MRALHAQLAEADASVVLGDNGSESVEHMTKGVRESSRTAAMEHALKLFFRRAARILKAEDPSFTCAETQRR